MRAHPAGARALLAWLGLVALSVLPYLGSLSFPLLYDDRTLLDNAWLARDAGVTSVFSPDYWYGTRHAGSDLYRPLTILTLAWNLRLAPGRVGFRLVDVLLHALVTLLVAGALRAILRDEARPRGPSFAAWAGAALFSVHPLASEAVLWAVGRAEILAAGFGLAAFRLFVDAGRQERRRGIRLVASMVLFSLALLSKESAASWLVIGAVWVVLSRGTAGARPALPKRRSLVFVGVLALFLVLRASVTGWAARPAHPLDNPLCCVGAATRIANAVLLEGRYLAKMAAPVGLSADHGYDQIPVVPVLPWGAPAAVLLAGAWVWVLRAVAKRSASAGFFWAFVPAAFAVTGNLVFPIGTIFAERLAYLPLVGSCALAAVGLDRIGRGRVGVLAVVLALAAARTFARTQDYRSLETFTEATAAASPRSVKALVNLGRTRLELFDRPADALDPLERAVSLWPAHPRALRLLARAEARLGHPDLAEEYARRATDADSRASADKE